MINNTDCAAGVQNCYVDLNYPYGMLRPPYQITDQPSYTPISWLPQTPEQVKAMVRDLVCLEIAELKKDLVREVLAKLIESKDDHSIPNEAPEEQ